MFLGSGDEESMRKTGLKRKTETRSKSIGQKELTSAVGATERERERGRERERERDVKGEEKKHYREWRGRARRRYAKSACVKSD